MITFTGISHTSVLEIAIRPFIRNKSVASCSCGFQVHPKTIEKTITSLQGEKLGKDPHYSLKTVSERVIKVLEGEQMCGDDNFKNYVHKYANQIFSTCFQRAKDRSPDLTEDAYIENIWAPTIFSGYRQHLRRKNSPYDDPGTILDKDFFSRE